MVKLWCQFKDAASRLLREYRLVAALAALCCWLVPSAGAATLTASLDRDTITLGESAVLTLEFSGAKPDGIPNLPDIPNLQIQSGSSGSQVSIINGQVTSTQTYQYAVTPRQAGNFIIPGLEIGLGGAKLSSQPLQLKVLKASAPTAEAINSGSQLAFFKLHLPKKEIFVGEIISAELQIYVREGLAFQRFQLPAIPADGFNVSEMKEAGHRRAQVGRSIYTVIPVVFTLKPIRTGSLTIGPITTGAVVGRNDPFFGMGFGGGERQQVTLTADAQTVEALPMPTQNMPANFNGCVGSYTMVVTAGPTNVAAGDPITVRVQISGRGPLDAITLPEQPAWRDFKTYPPTTKIDTGNDPFGLQGTKTFEQVVVPQSADIKELPPIEFSFFDPDQKAYRTLTQPATPLVVRPGGSAAAPTVVAGRPAQENSPPPTQDIVQIKPRLGTVAQVGAPLVQQPWFLLLQGVPVLAWASALVCRKRAEQLANNPRLRRQRQVAQFEREGLVRLRQFADANNAEEFFATLVRLLQEQLGERLDVPASAITEAVIDEHLRPRKTPETIVAPLHELFQTCNLARYAPIKSSQELAAIIPKLETVLRDLQGLKL